MRIIAEADNDQEIETGALERVKPVVCRGERETNALHR